jgi:hypothetical protein
MHKTYLVTKTYFQKLIIVQSNEKKVNFKVVLPAVALAILILAAACFVQRINEATIQLDGINQQTNKPDSFPQQSNLANSEVLNETSQSTTESGSGTVQSSDDGEQAGSSIITANDLAVYSDISCTQPLTSITWGTILSGGSVEKTIFVKNSGSAPLTLSLSTSNWNPLNAAQSITITWNKENAVLGSGQSNAAKITLAVAYSVSGISDFGVTIVIAGR